MTRRNLTRGTVTSASLITLPTHAGALALAVAASALPGVPGHPSWSAAAWPHATA